MPPDSELALQSVILANWPKIPGCEALRTESDKELGFPDLSLRCPWFEIPVELKFDDRALVRKSTTMAIPDHLTGNQESYLTRLWGRPFPSCVLHYRSNGSWVVIPAPVIPDYRSRPWVDFRGAFQGSDIRFLGPKSLIKAMDATWRILTSAPLLGPESPLAILRAMSMAPGCPSWLLGTPGAHGGPPGRTREDPKRVF